MQFRAGQVFGDWTLTKHLGAGGNGQVWAAVAADDTAVAIKFLHKTKPIAYKRFRNEVSVLSGNEDIPGILPVLDKHLPDTIDGNNPPWFAMPIADRLRAATSQLGLVRRVEIFLLLARTLEELHRRAIAHRDIKPSNLVWREGRAWFCDFGLVNFPGKEDLTGKDESLGPQWAMAPEVRRFGGKADSFPADVYSFAKTLWMLLAENEQGFEGQYSSEGALGLRRLAENRDDDLDRHAFWGGLDALLTDATEHQPERRPTMHIFRVRLQRWLAIATSWTRSNAQNWIALQRKLFPLGTPRIAVWRDINEIVRVLCAIGSTSSLNHMYFPDGGGMDLESASVSTREPGCIELHTTGDVSIVRPRSLTFASFGADAEWNYFRLETGELEPSGLYVGLADVLAEQVTEIPDVGYVREDAWHDDLYQGAPLHPDARPLLRYFRGPFAFFQKSSTYNMRFRVADLGCYDALHAKLSAAEFRSLIGKFATKSSSATRRGHPPKKENQ